MLVQQKQNIKGFSLLELLVVVAIIGLIAGIGYPRFDQWVSENRVRSEAEKIASLLSSVTTQVERGFYPYALIEFESGKFPPVITAKGVSQTEFIKRIKKPPAIKCAVDDFKGLWEEIATHTMDEETYLDKLTDKGAGGKGDTICFSKGGKYFKSAGLTYIHFDGESGNKDTPNYITICHNNSTNCNTSGKSFDTRERYDAYLVRYSRFGLITKYKWDYDSKDWIVK